MIAREGGGESIIAMTILGSAALVPAFVTQVLLASEKVHSRINAYCSHIISFYHQHPPLQFLCKHLLLKIKRRLYMLLFLEQQNDGEGESQR